MTSPAFNDVFAAEYEALSQHVSEAFVPAHFNFYLPDVLPNRDFDCIAVLQPAPELGAKQWTKYGRRLLLGVYKDEGRVATRQPAITCSWTRIGSILTCTSSDKHYLTSGDLVDFYNVNLIELRGEVTVTSGYTFTVATSVTGPNSGIGAFSRVAPIDFVNERVVYRLLPSFKLVPIAEVLAMFQQTAPLGRVSVAYDAVGNPFRTAVRNPGRPDNGYQGLSQVRHRQQFSENRAPLEQSYLADGEAMPSKLRSKVTTTGIHRSSAVSGTDAIRPVDFYGFGINDDARGPYFSNELVTVTVDNILERDPRFNGRLYDSFGLIVEGAISPNQLLVRDPLMPLEVDQFNVPLKAPVVTTKVEMYS